VVPEPLLLGPFALQHEPEPHATHHVLAGHLHPAFRLHGRGRQSLRLPCFCIGARLSLLPAFGSFTGMMEVGADPGRRLFVAGDDGVWQVA
ncbi:MAG TPA: DEAD/DEAH box helicase, partial [Pseudomonas sp.]|nr:DEAD/DEAH box helicase [Pseudomonas sp.]